MRLWYEEPVYDTVRCSPGHRCSPDEHRELFKSWQEPTLSSVKMSDLHLTPVTRQHVSDLTTDISVSFGNAWNMFLFLSQTYWIGLWEKSSVSMLCKLLNISSFNELSWYINMCFPYINDHYHMSRSTVQKSAQWAILVLKGRSLL